MKCFCLLRRSEAATRGVLFLKILQYSLENTYFGVSFSINLLKTCNFIKKSLQNYCFLWKFFKNNYFVENPQMAAFWSEV